MKTFEFRLVVTQCIDDDGANRLFEAGVDDGFPESGPSGHAIGFGREAVSLEEAILSAIKEVEASEFEVLRVEPDDLVSASDVAERTGRSRQSISALVSGARGPGDWPRPMAGNVRSPLWRWSDVAMWFESLDGSQEVERDAADLIAAINDVLEARRTLQQLGRQTRRRLLRELVT